MITTKLTYQKQTIPSKLLLFGEYTILLDSPALAIPFNGFNGYLDFITPTSNSNEKESNNSIYKLFNFIQKKEIAQYFHLDNFKKDIDNGLFFSSNIPQGYGLGSSGALCAAIAKKYGNKKLEVLNYNELKVLFSSIESFFHGKSSGIDPLVTYLNTPILIENENIKRVNIQWKEFNTKHLTLFLLDTEQTSETGLLVNWFQNQMKNIELNKQIKNEYITLLKSMIKSFLTIDLSSIEDELKLLSIMQLGYFTKMIPGDIEPIMREGIEKKEYYLKLCGSGGGGFMLGFSFMNKYELSTVFRNKNRKITYIN